MTRFAKVLAALLIAFAPAALAHADPRDRGEGHRGEARGNEGRGAARGGSYDRRSAPIYVAPGYGAYPAYPEPYPAYPPGRVYGAPTGPPEPYPYQPPPPGYVPNSLGAGWGQQQDQARNGVRQGRLMPLGQVMQLIRRSTPGRLLDAGLEPGPDGRAAYRVRWAATGGRRIDFIVDAVTGAILARTGY